MRHLRSNLLTLISVGIVVAFGYFLYINADKYRELLQASVVGVTMLFILSLASPFLNGMQNTLLYRSLGVLKFSFWDGYFLTAASTLANQLPIPGGIMSKGIYLKRIHNLSYTKFTSSTIALFFCFLSVNGVVGASVLLYSMLFKKGEDFLYLLIGFGIMISCIFVFWLPLERIKIPEKIYKWVNPAVEGWVIISRNPLLLLKIIGLQVILILRLAMRYWLAFHMLSQRVTIGQTILFASATILTQLVSLAPGGLGVREAVVGAVATILGFDTVVSVLAVGLDRLVVTVAIVITGWISTVILGKQISNASMSVDDE